MKQTTSGLPSINKPWLKHYSQKAISTGIPEGNMYHCIYEYNKDHLDGIALVYRKKQITYRHMFAQIDKLAECLWANGIRPGDHISILSLNTPETIYLLYAINKIGAISCPEYVTQPPSGLLDSLDALKPKMVIVLNVFLNAYRDVLMDFPGKILVLSPIETAPLPIRFFVHKKLGVPRQLPGNALNYADFIKSKTVSMEYPSETNIPAVYIPTSGSTGIPKKVVLTNRNLNAIAVQYPESGMMIRRGKKMLSLAPPFLSVGITLSIHMPIVCGVTLILSTDPSPESTAETFVQTKPNYYLGATEHIVKITEHPKLQKADLSFLYCCILGGEAISPALKEKINDFLLSRNAPNGMLTGYGMTEVGGAAITETNKASRDGSVGLPLPLINVKVRNLEDNSECAIGEHGELMLSSPGMMDCYFNNPSETQETIETDSKGVRWLHSGDLGYVDKDGFVYIVGRLKRIFTTVDADSGVMYKLFPGHIENELNKLPFVSRSAVLVKEDSTRVHVPVAYIRMEYNESDWEQLAMEHLTKSLPTYEIPIRLEVLDDIPLLPSGKIDYKRMEAQYLQ